MDPGSAIGTVLICIVLFVIAFIKACWMYDEYRYKQAQDGEPAQPVEVKPAPPAEDDSPIGKMISEELSKK